MYSSLLWYQVPRGLTEYLLRKGRKSDGLSSFIDEEIPLCCFS